MSYPENHGKLWTKTETNQLMKEIKLLNIKKISEIHKRTENAILLKIIREAAKLCDIDNDLNLYDLSLITSLKISTLIQGFKKINYSKFINDNDNDIDNDIDNVNVNEEKNKKINFPFEDWWILYDYKKNVEKCRIKWNRLSDQEKEECMVKTPDYVKSTPNKKFRKHPLTFLNNKSWNDEIIQTVTRKKDSFGINVAEMDYSSPNQNF